MTYSFIFKKMFTMRFVRNILALFIFTLLLNQANAQQVRLVSQVTFPPTINALGQSDTFGIAIINADTIDFNGNLVFNYTINGTLYTVSNDTSGIGFDSINSLFLAAGDSIHRTLSVHATTPKFQTGPSVVVIWPIVPFNDTAVIVRDSAKFTINIISNGINELANGKLYYNNRQIWLQNNSEIYLNRVRIIDITGRTVFSADAYNNRLPIPDMPAGIYVAEAVLSNNYTARLKFIYQNGQ